jgi:hypothetical protein
MSHPENINPTGAMLFFIPPGAKAGLSGPGVKTMLISDHLLNQAAIFSVGRLYNYLNRYIVKYFLQPLKIRSISM